MPFVNPTLPNDGESADAADISVPFNLLLAVFNGHIGGDNIEPLAIDNTRIADGTLTPSKLSQTALNTYNAWQNVTMNTTTWNTSDSFGPASKLQVRKDFNGNVQLRGHFRKSDNFATTSAADSGSLVFTLPVGYRPPTYVVDILSAPYRGYASPTNTTAQDTKDYFLQASSDTPGGMKFYISSAAGTLGAGSMFWTTMTWVADS